MFIQLHVAVFETPSALPLHACPACMLGHGVLSRSATCFALVLLLCACVAAVCTRASALLCSAADGCFKVDLKGVLYQATVLPLAGTALIANIGPTEAKVG
jgi:hypothetical protein